jgi:hypothetical protein
MRVLSKCVVAALATVASLAVPANAAPIAAAPGLQAAVAAGDEAKVESVQWRRGWRSGRWIGPAIVGGAILGAFAATRPYGYGYYGYGYGPGYYDSYAYAPGYAYEPSPYSGYAYAPGPSYSYRSAEVDDDAYCVQRFRSYDRASGTYLGYDGRRHPCP